MNPKVILEIDTTYHTGVDHFPRYDEIYRIFNMRILLSKDKDLGVYQNIQKRCIHQVVSRPMLFPYNEELDGVLNNLTREQP
jgi:hypothetical protein